MPGKAPVLIIDDEVLVQNLLGMLLEGDGFEVLSATSGARGLELARETNPEAIILDVGLPDMDGFEVCRRLREITDAVILFATAKDNREEIVRGLQLGGDDYVVKPYSYEELSARLSACLRRQGALRRPASVRSDQGEGLLLDPSQRLVFIEDGMSVQLTHKEFELLRFMVENRGRVLSVDEILTHVWGPAYVGERDLVKQFIYRLRSKLEIDPSNPRSIVTIRGTGYALEEATKPSGSTGGDAEAAGGDPLALARGTGTTPTRPGFRRGDIQRALEQSSGLKARTALQREAESDGLRRRVWRMWRSRSARVAIAIIFLLAGSASAAGEALPGGILYPAKRIGEDVRLTFAADDVHAVQLHLEFAGRRLDETASLLALSRPSGVPAIMDAYEDDVLQASWIMANMSREGETETELLEALMKAEARRHNRVMEGLMRTSPEEARRAIAHAAAVLNEEAKTVRSLFAEGEPATPMAAVGMPTVTETPLGLAVGIPTSGADGEHPGVEEDAPQTPPSRESRSPTSIIAGMADDKASSPTAPESPVEEHLATPTGQGAPTSTQGRLSDNEWGTPTATPTPTPTPSPTELTADS